MAQKNNLINFIFREVTMPRDRVKPLPLIAAPPHVVCEMLSIRDRDLAVGIKSGALPAYRVGNRRRIFIEDAAKWLRTFPQVKEASHAE